MQRPRVTILGAGPAGLGAAWRLAEKDKAEVIVLEQRGEVGGNAGSFELAGLPVDYGSHRLHPACDPKILADLKELLGDDLLLRPRHGRIRLQNRWIHFPLKATDLVTQLPPSFGMGVAQDVAGKFIASAKNGNGHHESFASVLEKGLGKTICSDFYFPYARKIWGVDPAGLSAIQARRRVSAGSMAKMAKKVASMIPGVKGKTTGTFYYPRGGYGQISRAIAEKATGLGADVRLNSTVRAISTENGCSVTYESNGRLEEIKSDLLWSTIPLTVLIRSVQPKPPEDVKDAAGKIAYRAMILVYLVLERDHWTEFDAHYFPEESIPITRISEPKNYSASSEPFGRTILCAELPCEIGDGHWTSSDVRLKQIVCEALETCGLPVDSPVSQVVTKRLPFAYPIYRDGYEKYFELQDKWVSGLDGILTFGRQGLFAHDNTHHALAMAYGAVDCLDHSGNFDQAKWTQYRDEFEKHVVED